MKETEPKIINTQAEKQADTETNKDKREKKQQHI